MRYPTQRPVFLDTLQPEQQYTYTTTIGNKCFVRARTADGSGVYVESKYQPTYYLPCNEHTGFTSFDGFPLLPHVCDTIRDGREFLKSNPRAYGNIQPEYMLLSDVYGDTEIVPDMKRLYIWDIDIEVDSADAFAPPDNPFNEIVSITVTWSHMDASGTVVYGMKPYEAGEGVVYVECPDEQALMREFMTDWKNGGNYPDIVTGWHVQFFDIPYIINRMRMLFGEEFTTRLSPFETIKDRRVTLNHRDEQVFDIIGVTVLDYYELYRKFTYTQQENYRLDTIAHIELGERKLSYEEYETLAKLYRDNFTKFIDYNIRDVALVQNLDKKLKFIELVCALAYSAKANFVDTFRQVRLWDIMIYHRLRSRNQHIPPKRDVEKTEQYAGGYVKEPVPGMYHWVCSFDVASMYPHIIREWNLSPETIVDRTTVGKWTVDDFLEQKVDTQHWINGNDNAMSGNGLQTSRAVEGFLPEMLKSLYEERARYKGLMDEATATREQLEKSDPQYAILTDQIAAFNNQQLVRKVNLNSAYGALGSEYFRFYDTHLAEAVTLTGQMVIRWVAKNVNAFLNTQFKTEADYVIASDTDSIYVRLEPLIDLFKSKKPDATMDQCVTVLARFCDAHLEPLVARTFDEIADYLNVAVPCLLMKREIIADKGIWTGKKHYILNVRDKDRSRLREPKLKMLGIETVKSSTPALCRAMLRTAINLVMNGTEEDVWKFVASQRPIFNAAKFEDIAFPRSVNKLDEYTQVEKSVPIAVRGALVYNRQIAEMSRGVDQIRDGQKIKFAYLKEPNPFGSNIMSAPDGCPTEWQIGKWIDYETQWNKAFVTPLDSILGCAGWHIEKQDSLF